MPDSTFDWHDTPDPTQRIFSVVAKEPPTALTIPDLLNSTVTWATCPKWIKEAEKVPSSLQGWRLVHAQKAGFQQRMFFFAETRTPLQRRTHFDETWTKRPFGWPTVLLKLWAEEGRIPLSGVDTAGDIISEASLLTRTKYKPGGMYPTWFRIRHYLSEQRFPRSSSQRVPITDSIHWEFDGLRGGFPECLHPGVTVPNDSTTGRVLFGFGTPSVEIGGDIISQKYPPTNMRDWESYVLEDDRRPVMGIMEHRIIVEAFPPTDFRPPNLATA